MATFTSYTGSKLIGCPIVYGVRAATLVEGATFHRVRIVVRIGSTDFEFSTPAENNEEVFFDISSALRAMAEKYEYTATNTNPSGGSYPYWTATVTAYDDYLLNGEEKHTEGVVSTDGGNFFVGKLTDRERIVGTSAWPAKWSRKPTSSPEIVHIGKSLIVAADFSSNPRVSETSITSQTQATATYYPIAAPADSYSLRFINSLGVHESLHITCLRQTEVNIKTDHYVISQQETISKFSRGVVVKQNDYEQWKMSSGPLDKAWQQYYLHEVLMAEKAWIDIDGVWLPVHIIPEETVTGIDRTNKSVLTVEFTIRFDINGSPFA